MSSRPKMPKQISQETFDAVVHENMEEFEMDLEAAVKDSVQQFESQGVDLSNILKHASLYSEEPDPIVASLEQLERYFGEVLHPEADVVHVLDSFISECALEGFKRQLAAAKGAYSVLVKGCRKQQLVSCFVMQKTLTALFTILNGQSSIFDSDDCEFFVQLLNTYSEQSEIVESTMKVVKFSCVKNECCRQTYVLKGIVPVLINLLKKRKGNGGLVREICATLQELMLDDDESVPFGKAHERAKTIVTESDGLNVILEICQEHTGHPDVLGELLGTLSKLLVRNEFCQEVLDKGGLRFLLDIFAENIHDTGNSKQLMCVLKSLAGNDKVKVEIAKAGGVELIVAAMLKHQSSIVLAEVGCALLAALALRSSPNCRQIIACQGEQVIVQTMKIHKTRAAVQKQACMAVRNIVSRDRQYCSAFLELGVEVLINEIMKTSECEDTAKAALRDLGCKVDLKELWTGKRGSINQ